ncbi:hypothetical protein AX16_003220 [Volvariella volvacea WC 439]|nr:hypothetical protein AX16_003220 [Volvariella volvacea WC 439]
MPRQVQIDDNDARVSYSSGWSLVRRLQEPGELFGPNFEGTLHQTSEAGSFSFSIPFRGYHALVYGVSNFTAVDGVSDPSYECFVDSQPIRNLDPFSGGGSANNWILCAMDSASDGNHVLTVNVTSLGAPFQFDRVQFVPGAGYPIDTAQIRVEFDDGDIRYDDDWVLVGGVSRATGTAGSKVTFPFIGKSLAWGAFLPGGAERAASSGTYSVDGSDPATFDIPGLEGESPRSLYNQILFTTPDLEPGRHSIEVAYQGTNSNQSPLSLTWLLVTNATFVDDNDNDDDDDDDESEEPPNPTPPPTPSNSDSNTSSGTNTRSSNTDTSSGYTLPPGNPTISPENPWPPPGGLNPQDNSSSGASPATIGGIVGGIVGGAGLLAVVAILLWFWCRRKDRQQKFLDDYKDRRRAIIDSPPPEPVPFVEPVPAAAGTGPQNGASLVIPSMKAQEAFGGSGLGATGAGTSSVSRSASASSTVPQLYPIPTSERTVASGSNTTSPPLSPISSGPLHPNPTPLTYTPTHLSHGSYSLSSPPSESSHAHLRPSNNNTSTPPDEIPLPPIVVVHQDSGLRLGQRIEDVPPEYTPN